MQDERQTIKNDKYGNDKYHSDSSSLEETSRFHRESANQERRAHPKDAGKILSNAGINKLMESIEKTFSDKGGNHLLVALYFYDSDYKQKALNIPEEYSNVNIIDIDITKAFVDMPINPIVFFQMSDWLLKQFEQMEDTIFTFICSTGELDTHHPEMLPQKYRWDLFDRLYQRKKGHNYIRIQDVIVGPEGYQSYGRAFYHETQSPIIHIISAYLQEKQQNYNE